MERATPRPVNSSPQHNHHHQYIHRNYRKKRKSWHKQVTHGLDAGPFRPISQKRLWRKCGMLLRHGRVLQDEITRCWTKESVNVSGMSRNRCRRKDAGRLTAISVKVNYITTITNLPCEMPARGALLHLAAHNLVNRTLKLGRPRKCSMDNAKAGWVTSGHGATWCRSVMD